MVSLSEPGASVALSRQFFKKNKAIVEKNSMGDWWDGGFRYFAAHKTNKRMRLVNLPFPQITKQLKGDTFRKGVTFAIKPSPAP